MNARHRPFRPLRWAWLLLLAVLVAPAWELFLPAGLFPPPERRTVLIERGTSLQRIATELQRVGVIHSSFSFLALARLMRLDRSLKAGQYSFKLGTSVPALLRALDRGMYGLDLVRIPEGLTLRETRDLLVAQCGMSAAAFDSVAQDPALLDSLGVVAPSVEGWLAPDSYEWLPGTTPEVAIRTMVARTRERLQRATAGCDSLPLGMSLLQVLTLASIVESEAQEPSERPIIARVYLNRLQIGMKLQADPTAAFANGMRPRSRLLYRHLKVPSPYNTYYVTGLPPGPICSPGYSCIEAVISASPGVKDLYFVARGDGRHFFSRTFEQHSANIMAAKALQAVFASRRDSSARRGSAPESLEVERAGPAASPDSSAGAHSD